MQRTLYTRVIVSPLRAEQHMRMTGASCRRFGIDGARYNSYVCVYVSAFCARRSALGSIFLQWMHNKNCLLYPNCGGAVLLRFKSDFGVTLILRFHWVILFMDFVAICHTRDVPIFNSKTCPSNSFACIIHFIYLPLVFIPIRMICRNGVVEWALYTFISFASTKWPAWRVNGVVNCRVCANNDHAGVIELKPNCMRIFSLHALMQILAIFDNGAKLNVAQYSRVTYERSFFMVELK